MIPLHVFLIGMAGSGKTSLGKKLASQVDLPFLDTDERVAEMMGMEPKDVYARFGEDFFHNAETGVLIELVDQPPSIVSTGGGLPLVKENVQLMQNHGIIILIDRPLDQILSDIRTENRPGLRAGDHEDVIQEYNQRIGFYRACADHTFSNDRGFVVGAQGLINLVNEIFSPRL
ncbi:MAG: shikimate kinase [Christensenellales bacterium]